MKTLKTSNQEMHDQIEKLWAKYQIENRERKYLHNQLEDMKGKIRVYCRVRPLSAKEQLNSVDAISL